LLQTSKLQLFHGAFGATHLIRDCADTLFFSKAHCDNTTLIDGERVYQPEDLRPELDFFETDLS
jgi:hypothetical protein